MPLTQAQKDEFDMNCYGMLRDDLAHLVDRTLGGPHMLAVSLLSDAQEQIARGQDETARKTINMAKWVIGERLQEIHPDQEPPHDMTLGSLAELI